MTTSSGETRKKKIIISQTEIRVPWEKLHEQPAMIKDKGKIFSANKIKVSMYLYNVYA